MIVDQQELAASHRPLLVAAWSALDAANDLRDASAIEACRRVIDANLRGGSPAQSDISVVFGFFK
jgi:hypothetical protein